MSRSRSAAPLPPDLGFYITPPHPCGYFSTQEATTLFADPAATMNTTIYDTLTILGFRRTGSHLYRPRCQQCNACIPVRIPVAAFRSNRSQRRTWRSNADITVTLRADKFNEEHYALYRRYITHRHGGGSMDIDSRDHYYQFLHNPWGETRFVEFRLGKRLLAVAVTDILDHALSAVYTFFDPNEQRRALGVHAILWEIAEAERRELDYLYLGYLIEASPKMAYKRHYKPLEYFSDGYWKPYPTPGRKTPPDKAMVQHNYFASFCNIGHTARHSESE